MVGTVIKFQRICIVESLPTHFTWGIFFVVGVLEDGHGKEECP